MKKILLFNHASVIGGAGLSFLDIIDSIDRDKFEIVVYNVSDKPIIADELERKGIRVIRAGKSPVPYSHFSGGERFALSPSSIKNYLRILKDKKRIKRVINAEKPDIVVVNSMTLFWIGKLVPKNIVSICFDRETFAKGLLGVRTKIIKHYLSKYFDKVAYISRFDMDEVNSSKSKGYVVYDRLDYDKYQIDCSVSEMREQLGLPKDKFLVLFAGGLSYLKGAHLAFKAMSVLDNHNIKLVDLQGEVPQKKKKKLFYSNKKNNIVYNAYSKMKNKEDVIFLETVNCIEKYIHACDIMIFPSAMPHQGRPIYEAGAGERLIIVSDYPNTREHVVDGKNGLTFRVNDANDLAKKILYAYQNKNTKEEQDMLALNKQNAREYHDIKTLKDDIANLLND